MHTTQNQSQEFKKMLLEDTKASQKFCNILVCASLWHIYRGIEVVQAMEGSHCG